MKKTIIATIVGGLLLFLWQFASWSALNVHGSGMQYTPKQATILQSLAAEGLEEGAYFLPNVKPGATAEDYEAYKKANIGKPWAQISYHKSMNDTMGMNMFRAFIIDLLAAFLLVWILMSNKENNFKLSLITSLAIGLVGYCTISYLDSIWFETKSIPYLIDTVVAFGLVGCWLGWYLPEKK